MSKVAAVATVLAAAAHYQSTAAIPPDAANDQDPAGTALVGAFSRFCLEQFPEPAQVATVPGQVTPLPASAVRQYLHDDPGRGWTYKSDGGEYIVTIEDPPFHTCAVRRFYRTPPHYRLPWLRATETWAAAGHGSFAREMAMPPQKQPTMTIEGRARILTGPVKETFLEISTTYPDGTFEQRLARTYGR